MTDAGGVEYLDLTSELGPSPGYAYVAKASGGTSIFTAGAVPLDRDGKLVGNDLQTQTRAVVANLETALRAAGASARDVVKTTVYVASSERGELSAAWRVFAESELVNAPSTLLGVTTLGYDGQLVEIEAVAVIDR